MDFRLFSKNMGKNIGKNLSKKLSSIYSPDMVAVRQKLLNHTKQYVTGTFNRFKKAIQKTAEASCDLIGNKSANKITKASTNSPYNRSEKQKVKHKY